MAPSREHPQEFRVADPLDQPGTPHNACRVFPGRLTSIVKSGMETAGQGMMEADYVVIGAGSAGCVATGRLSEDGAHLSRRGAAPQ